MTVRNPAPEPTAKIPDLPPGAARIVDPRGGANLPRVRAHNERLVLSLVRRHGQLAKADIARRSGLSAQTVTVIMRALEQDQLVTRLGPVRGRVGQPSVPIQLNPDGVFAVGLKIGRRSAALVLMDFVGNVRRQTHITYPFPNPKAVQRFLQKGFAEMMGTLSAAEQARIAGIGVAAPDQLWQWPDHVGAPANEMQAWQHVDIADLSGAVTGLPVFVQNDATAACGAELVFGRGREYADFAYFFVGSFIGGGLVLNNGLHTGANGNAGAFGSMLVRGKRGKTQQLIDTASLFLLENRLRQHGIDPSPLWLSPDTWPEFGHPLRQWIKETASAIAGAAISIVAVTDVDAIFVDGAVPDGVRRDLCSAVARNIAQLDHRGIALPEVVTGSIGADARVMGAGGLPLFQRYLIDEAVLFKE